MSNSISAGNPYPGPDDASWTRRLAEAIQEYSRWPLEVAEDIAAYVVRPKDYLIREGGRYRLRDGVVTRRAFGSEVEHHIFSAFVHGFMGSLTEYNERVRSAFPAPAAPGATGLTLPKLSTQYGENGEPLALLATVEVVEETIARTLIRQTVDAMTDANGRRTWDLPGELLLHGQEEASMHAVVQRRFRDDEGQEYVVTDPMAIIGNNRSQARQECLGIREGTHFGFAPSINGWNPSADEANTEYSRSAVWVPKMARLLQRAWEEVHPELASDNLRKDAHQLAREGSQLATVPAQFILKVTQSEGEPVQRFERVVWEPNRTSHRRQPLEYDPHERATAEVRALVSAYVDAQYLSSAEAEWLAGDAPAPDEVSVGKPGMTNADLRDLRDLRLWRVVFPGNDDERSRLVRQTLGEPPAGRTLKEHVTQRLRLVTAAISVGYAQKKPWSERVNDSLLRARAIADGWSPSDRDSAQLLRAAAKGGTAGQEALEDFVITRGLNWLAFHDLYVADRGSIGMGQKTQGLVRRGAPNVRDALVRNPVQAVGLFREMQRSSGKVGQPSGPVRQVDEMGTPIPDTVADAHWFLATFPKSARTSSAPDPGQTRLRKPTKAELLYDAREEFVEYTFDELLPAVAGTFGAAERLAAAAIEAGQAALETDATGTVERLREAFNFVRRDAAGLLVLLNELEDPRPSITVTSECASLASENPTEEELEESDNDLAEEAS